MAAYNQEFHGNLLITVSDLEDEAERLWEGNARLQEQLRTLRTLAGKLLSEYDDDAVFHETASALRAELEKGQG